VCGSCVLIMVVAAWRHPEWLLPVLVTLKTITYRKTR
jgi:hypothetical protein